MEEKPSTAPEKELQKTMPKGTDTPATAPPVVKTEYGQIQGRRIIDDTQRPVNAFQGVPYAKPPNTPELRFKVLSCCHFRFYLFVIFSFGLYLYNGRIIFYKVV